MRRERESTSLQDNIGDETAHEQAEQGLDGVESGTVLEKCLRTGGDRPADHDERNPPIGTELLADETAGQLGRQKRGKEDGLAVIEVVCVHSDLGQPAWKLTC